MAKFTQRSFFVKYYSVAFSTLPGIAGGLARELLKFQHSFRMRNGSKEVTEQASGIYPAVPVSMKQFLHAKSMISNAADRSLALGAFLGNLVVRCSTEDAST